MKVYKQILTKVVDSILCDICHQNCNFDSCGNEYATLEAVWGYCSEKDGQKFDVQLCEKCFDDLVDWMIQKRKKNLNYPTYHFDKNPLYGE